jgi:hypothetical protein
MTKAYIECEVRDSYKSIFGIELLVAIKNSDGKKVGAYFPEDDIIKMPDKNLLRLDCIDDTNYIDGMVFIDLGKRIIFPAKENPTSRQIVRREQIIYK